MKKGFTVKAHIPLTMEGGGKGYAVHTMGMDGEFYIAMAGWGPIKPATFSSKKEAQEFYFAQRKRCFGSSVFIEGPKGGYYHVCD
jgi:hypothetical protein